MKKCIGVLFALSLSFAALAEPLPDQARFASKSVFAIDVDSGEVIVERKADDVRSIASITKLMTAVVVVESGVDLEELVHITPEERQAVKTFPGKLPANTAFTRAELLHLALMNSSNVAAFALAKAHPTGVEGFIADMNETAKRLEMNDTEFVDPTGLYAGNKSTAKDLITLVVHASNFGIINDFSTAKSFEVSHYFKNRQRTIGFRTTNPLIVATDWNIITQKTGFTRAAGRCVVMLIEMAERKVAIVLLNSRSSREYSGDTALIKYWLTNGALPSNVSEINPIKQPKKRRARKVASPA